MAARGRVSLVSLSGLPPSSVSAESRHFGARPQPRPRVGTWGDRLPPGLSPGPAAIGPQSRATSRAGGRAVFCPCTLLLQAFLWKALPEPVAKLVLRAWPDLRGRINRPDCPSYSLGGRGVVYSSFENVCLPSSPTHNLITQFSFLHRPHHYLKYMCPLRAWTLMGTRPSALLRTKPYSGAASRHLQPAPGTSSNISFLAPIAIEMVHLRP